MPVDVDTIVQEAVAEFTASWGAQSVQEAIDKRSTTLVRQAVRKQLTKALNARIDAEAKAAIKAVLG